MSVKCSVCLMDNPRFIDTFKPYIDKEWMFDMYECTECLCRFVQRDSQINYHEEIHTQEDSPYRFHYQTAQEVKDNLDNLSYIKKIISRRKIIKKVLDHISNQAKSIRILELGCSTGYVTAYLRELGFDNAVGMDISESAISFANDMFGKYYYTDSADLGEFDLIFHSGLIGCVETPLAFLKEYLSYLTDSGRMLFNAPNVESVLELKELWTDTPPPDLITLFHKNVFEKYISSQDFLVQMEETSTPYFIYNKMKAKLQLKVYNQYPTHFIAQVREPKFKAIYKFIDMACYRCVYWLIRYKLVQSYSDEYGLLVEIRSK